MSTPSERRRGVVTGAGSGIGKAVVRRLLRENVDVLAVDINAGSLADLQDPHCELLTGDVSDPAFRGKVADWADGASYLVNSAGVIVIKSQSARSQEANKAVAMARLQEMVDACSQAPTIRKPTKPTYGSKQRRLQDKAIRSRVKADRGSLGE